MEVEIDMLESDGSIVKKSIHDEDVIKPTSDEFENDDDDDDDYDDDDDDDYDDGDDDDGDYIFENFEVDDEAHYLSIQAQFDKFDLPSGVEASFSWLNDLSTPIVPVNTLDQEIPNPPFCKSKDVASSSSSVEEKEEEKEAKKKFENFKLFDIVEDFSDHHFNASGFQEQQPRRKWTKKIQNEWKILEKDLPDSIFVRAYETRMDLLRAVVIGPAGTPYHDGLFVFDIQFPPTYPDTPPIVYYYSGGLRLNPNLYQSGKVCLSLLNTWNGSGCEKWMPNKSTMLQVLVSIQALILTDKPFFNEPGYDKKYTGPLGEKKSMRYNENVFFFSLKTMIYTLKKPPKHFEDFVIGHFRSRAHTILSACRAYMEGVQVGGSTVNGDPLTPDDQNDLKPFKAALPKMVNDLVSIFTTNGATDCDQFLFDGSCGER